MKTRLLLLLDAVRSSYWFLPTLMLAGSAALAAGLVALDQRVDTGNLRGVWWIFSGGAEGARSVLSTVAGSVISVAGTTFSITIAVLSLTSSQFGPRLLRGFLRDRGNQIVLGTFVATFLYCLLVLRMVRSVDEALFVPHIAVTGGVALAVASVCVLIYFIHHVAVSIQAGRIVAGVALEMDEAIERLFPEEIGREIAPPLAPPPPSEDARAVAAHGSGYVQSIDGDALLALAREKGLLIRLRRSPGRFVGRGGILATIEPAGERDADTEARINAAVALGEQRTAAQDAEFPLLQLSEVAVRALSPGINDPYTALLCLDRIGAALCRLARRARPSPLRFDERGTLRVVAEPVAFADMVEAALGEIRHYGSGDPLVVRRLREVIDEALDCARDEARRDALRREAARLPGPHA